MRKKIVLGVLGLTLLGGVVAYKNKTAIILKIVAGKDVAVVGSAIDIDWDQGPKTAETPASERLPNIVFILADDLGINDISTFGGGVASGAVPTPNIDRLAAQGVIFTQAYAGNAICAPSRAMLMTGRYPTRTGFEFTPIPPGMGRMISMIGNEMSQKNKSALPKINYNKKISDEIPGFFEQGLPSSEVTVAEVLKTRGYHTAHIGKWHLGYGEMSPLNQGFDESLEMQNMYYLPKDDPNVVNAKLDFDPIDKFLWARGQFSNVWNGGKPFKPKGYLTDYWTDESLKVIDANKNRPFFLYLAHWGVHTPLQTTREDFDAVGDIQPHRLRVYAGMVRALDRSVGRVMDKLEEEGLSDNTIIVFSSDNGGAGYIGLPEINAPYRGWKLSMFEGGIRAPMFVKWPAKIAAGTQVETPVAHIDVMPTLVAAAGGTLPEGVKIDGKNLLPLATGEGDFERENDALFWQSGYLQVVRAGDWKLQHEGRRDKYWLYDLANDPTEQTNLADKNPEKLEALKALLKGHQKNRKMPLYPYTIESPIALDKTLADPTNRDDEYAWWPN